EATVSGPVSSNQDVLSGRHSPANSPPNPSPHPAGLLNPSPCLAFLGSRTPAAGLGHSHPNQPQLRLKTGLGHSHPNQPQLQPKTGTGLVLNHPNHPQLQPKTGLVPNLNLSNQPQPIPASHAGLDPSLPNYSPSLHPSLINLQPQLQFKPRPRAPASPVPEGGQSQALTQALTQGLDGHSALVRTQVDSLVGLIRTQVASHLLHSGIRHQLDRREGGSVSGWREGIDINIVLNVPYNLNLQRGIYDKMMITIMGQVKPNAKQFTVNFLRGKDIAFHLNSRFNEGGKQAVVRNHKVGERWGKEERHTQGGFPFMAGQSFEMKILVTSGEFKVAVNGTQLFEFKHRIRELNQIDRINILHDVILTSVNVDTIP
ncbi:unnamed protein product, partial [Coregonus sp. 'balchen']